MSSQAKNRNLVSGDVLLQGNQTEEMSLIHPDLDEKVKEASPTADEIIHQILSFFEFQRLEGSLTSSKRIRIATDLNFRKKFAKIFEDAGYTIVEDVYPFLWVSY